jgi:hypothetical protein
VAAHRDIGEPDLLMTMHGTFWRFPRDFSATKSAGITPRSTYLKVIGDFCRWNDQLVFGCDDTAKSEFLNKRKLKGALAGAGQSQSNLWFSEPKKLDQLGPVIGRGAVWLEDEVNESTPSDPYLFSGYTYRSLHLAHDAADGVSFTIEVDVSGNGTWTVLRKVEVPAHGAAWLEFSPEEKGTGFGSEPDGIARGLQHSSTFGTPTNADPKRTPFSRGSPLLRAARFRAVCFTPEEPISARVDSSPRPLTAQRTATISTHH